MPTKSCESDAIPTSLLKEILPKLAPTLAQIANISLQHGVFADSWKVAIIRPLLKKAGLDLIASNYRPVSNLAFLSKLIEKAVLEQFTEYCNAHALLPDYQSAYKANYSCETSVTHVFNDILWAMEWQEICSMCLCDLSMAFDTVNHQVLLTRFGVDHTALK